MALDTPELVQRSKLRVQTRMQMVSKINPAKYGDRLEIANTEAEARGMTDEQLVASVRGALTNLGITGAALDAISIPAFGHEAAPSKKRKLDS